MEGVNASQNRGQYFVEDLDAKLTVEKVKTAVCIIIDPKSATPHVYQRGSSYQSAKVLCQVVKQLKQQLMDELSV